MRILFVVLLIVVGIALAIWVIINVINHRKFTYQDGFASLGIIISLIGVVIALPPPENSGAVRVSVGSRIDDYNRCVDAELLIENLSEQTANDIELAFDVDYFTKHHRAMDIEYGDEKEQLIPPSKKMLLARKPYISVNHAMDYENSKMVIPKLKPNEYLHLYYNRETVKDWDQWKVRDELLKGEKPPAELLNRPRLISATMDDGTIEIKRVIGCRVDSFWARVFPILF